MKEHGKSSVNDIAHALNHAGGEKFPQLIKVISAMERKRQLRFNRDGSVSLRPKKEHPNQVTVEGVFHANKNGFGFLHVDDSEDDMFIGRNDVGHAIDGDTVAAVIKKPADRLRGTMAEARVVEIVERSLKTVVGKFILNDEKEPYVGYIKSKNQKIQQPIYIKKGPVALEGTEIIKVDIEKYPNRHHDYFVGSVRDIIGHQGDAGIDVLEVLESMDIVSEFPEDVMAEAEAVPDAPSQEDLIGRVDLRQEVTFTIDGADAKDLDDAVHIKRLPNGNYELGVHIADVSYYVTEGSALNREAAARGTSVYVTDRVVPMLPERLSNGICSLNPNVDRLTLSAIMEITPKGKVINHKICQSVIKTTFRMTYSDVNEMLAGNPEKIEQFKPIMDSVSAMAELHKILEDMRERRGALNFDTSEARILVNDKGMPVDIVVRERGTAERMIESFMLAAMAHELSETKKVATTIIHYPSFTIDVKNGIKDGSVKEQIDAVKEAEVLVLDDIGAEQFSSWIRDDVLQVILQYRMIEELPTFFTSNYSFADLEAKLSNGRQGDETWQAKRVMERIRFLAKEVHLRGVNRR